MENKQYAFAVNESKLRRAIANSGGGKWEDVKREYVKLGGRVIDVEKPVEELVEEPIKEPVKEEADEELEPLEEDKEQSPANASEDDMSI